MPRIKVSIQPVVFQYVCVFYDPTTSKAVGRARRFNSAEKVDQMLIRAGVDTAQREAVIEAMGNNRPITVDLDLTDGQLAKLRGG